MRGLRLRLAAPLLLTTFAGCGGCERRADATGRDATTDVAVDDGRSVWRARVAARVLGSQAVVARLDDGALALSSGLFVHRIGKGGAIERLGKPEDYLPFVPESEEDRKPNFPLRERLVITGRYDHLFVTPRAAPTTSFVWDRQRWTKATEQTPLETPKLLELEGRYDTNDGDPDRSLLPKGPTWAFRVRLPDGRRAWSSAEGGFFVVDAKGTSGAIAALPTRAADGGHCRFLESADDNLYANCHSIKSGVIADALVRLEGATWVEVRLPNIADRSFQPTAIDSEGGIWLIGPAPNDSLVRASRDGRAETIALPDSPDDLSRASYYTNEPISRAVEPTQSRTTITARQPPDSAKTVVEIIPRKSGEVWIVAKERATVLYRVAHDGVAHAPLLVTSLTDDEVAVQNARGARDWVGHCRQIFVTLASAAPGQNVTSSRAAERLADIREALGPATSGYVVTGRLSGQSVAGVVLLQFSSTAEGEKSLEMAATRLIEKFTTDPASPTRATCTLPVLDELIFEYP